MIYNNTTPEIQQFDLNLEKQKPILREPAGFGESYLQDLSLFWRENLSISRDIALSKPRQERAQRIREIAGDDAFVKVLTIPGDPKTVAMIEALAAQHPGEIQSDSEISAGIKARNKTLRQERDTALANQTTGGKIGGFLGVMTGALSDPITLGTLPLGASWATGILKTALIEGGIGAATEALIQPAIYRYKQELESPYDMSDVLINVAGAGVGAGVLTGGVKATARAISKFGRFNADIVPNRVDGFDDILEAVEKLEDDAFTLGKAGDVPDEPRFTLTDEQRAAKEVLQQHTDTLRQSPFEPHPQLDDLHLDALAKATNDVTNGRAVDVSDFIEQPRLSAGGGQFRPALKVDGVIVSGDLPTGAKRGQIHADLIDKLSPELKEKFLASNDDTMRGFLDDAGNYLTREEASALRGPQKIPILSEVAPIEKRFELSAQRELDDFDRIMEGEAQDLEAGRITQGRKVKELLDEEDMKIILDDGTTRSAREVIEELDLDAKAAAAVKTCMAG